MANTFNLTGTFKDAENNILHAGQYISFRVTSVGSDAETDIVYPRNPVDFLVDANGDISGTLWVNGNDLTTTYEIRFPDGEKIEVQIPSSVADDATVDLTDILINYQVTTSGSQQVTLDAAKAYTDALAANPSSNASLSASEWRTDLGLVIGTDVQAYDAQLADIAGLTPTDGNIIVGNGTNFVAESGATARTSLGLGAADAVSHGSLALTTDLAVIDGGTGAGTAAAARTNLGAQAQGDVLDDLNTLGAATADGEFIVATGAGAFAYESGTTARTSLGLQPNSAGSTTSVTATTYTALTTDSVLLCNNASGVTVTLMPAATAGDGFIVVVKNIGSAGTTTIDADGTETIDGSLTSVLLQQYDALQLVSDGSNWHII